MKKIPVLSFMYSFFFIFLFFFDIFLKLIMQLFYYGLELLNKKCYYTSFIILFYFLSDLYYYIFT